ncbi:MULTISPECIES: DUF2750 domain-containing protein [unclassified Agarivorans]|uniref:DUF2750 domain-containing protein n=1 Tax=unclassified Agarivorans TaxID=2636026 RepID=UPI003D7D4C44
MSTSENNLSDFSKAVIKAGELWVLSADDEFVVVDSINYENTDVMPLFSTAAKAQALCLDDWSEYQVVSINLEEFFEQWLPNLDEDKVLVAIDLDENLVGEEIEAFHLAKQLAADDAK